MTELPPILDVSDVIAQIWRPLKPGANMYMLLDAARDLEIAANLAEFGTQSARSLFDDTLAHDAAPFAPYLVALSDTLASTRALIEQAWGQSWGIFLESAAPMETLRKHLQGLLLVKDELGRRLHFRYYDPRVLRTYLPTCNAADLGIVFGPVTRYALESADTGKLISYTVVDGQLVAREAALIA